MSTDRIIAETVSAAARRGYAIRLQSGNGGNLSARLSDGRRIVIKASGVSFADCTPERLLVVDLETGRAENGTPSRELLSHLAIYRARPQVNAIFHCHGPWSIACAHLHDEIPAIARHSTAKVGGIPVLRTGVSPSPSDVADAIEHMLAQQPAINAFVEAAHGIFSMAGDIDTAAYNAELVEETAQVALLSRSVGAARVGRQ